MGKQDDITAGDYVSTADLTVDNCDREPIHIPGAIQPFGAMLAGEKALATVQYASANLGELTGLSPDDVLGKAGADILPRQAVHDLRNVVAMSTARTQRERVGRYDVNGRTVELYAHVNPKRQTVLEIEHVDEALDAGSNPAVDRMRVFLAKAAQQTDLTRMLQVCTIGLHALTGYDRVMAYRYAPDGSGEVVAETLNPGVESFLGLRYPAWDVPTQARALQVKNPVRTISDIHQEPVPVLAAHPDLPDLDMSLAHLRGISPVHTEYLANMGVGATLTIGLIVHGKLWGMFSCHHTAPKLIRSDVRIAVELFGQMISLLVQERLEIQGSRTRERASEARRKILAETENQNDVLYAFPRLAPIFRDLIDCDGLAVLRDDEIATDGDVPSRAAIRALAKRRPADENLIESTDSLQAMGWADGHPLDDTAGSLMVRATASFPLQLIFFRNEKTRNISWAGRPEKELVDGKYGPRITPRGSFKAYMEQQSGRAEDWQDADIGAAREMQVLLTQITAKGERLELLRHKDLVTNKRQQDLMIAELNHRVKNILALIRSLSRQAKTSADSLESYAQALEKRIGALATAHDLAVANSLSGVSLREIVETELQPYLRATDGAVTISGLVVGLRADVAPMIALVFHEVVTNAAKYGALSVKQGRVLIDWSVDEDGLAFSWVEENGPPVTPPTRKGFGQNLIRQAIPYEFDGTVEQHFPADGARFSFTLPASTLVQLDTEDEPSIVGEVGTVQRAATGRRVLLLEDNLILAMDMVESLTRLGADDVESAATVERAMDAINAQDFDAAVLDMNIRGTVSFDVAEALRAKGVPFVFVTGYGEKMALPDSIADTPVLNKPVDDGTLSRALGELLG